jgi:hypothetical protein
VGDRNFLAEIEKGALDPSTDLADILRKCITLGGETRSADLRTWAALELRGYGPEDELPPYRIAHSLLYLDAAVGGNRIVGQQAPYQVIPDEVRSVIDGEIRLAYPVAELSEVIANARRKGESAVNLSLPHAIEMTALINHRLRKGEDRQWRQVGLPSQQVVERVY